MNPPGKVKSNSTTSLCQLDHLDGMRRFHRPQCTHNDAAFEFGFLEAAFHGLKYLLF